LSDFSGKNAFPAGEPCLGMTLMNHQSSSMAASRFSSAKQRSARVMIVSFLADELPVVC
jgi:hypothetical protein